MDNFRNECKIVKTKNLSPLEHVYSMSYMSLSDIYMSSSIPTSSFSRLAICRSFLSLFTSWEAWLFCIHVTIYPACCHIFTSSFSRLAICRSFLSLFTSLRGLTFLYTCHYMPYMSSHNYPHLSPAWRSVDPSSACSPPERPDFSVYWRLLTLS